MTKFWKELSANRRNTRNQEKNEKLADPAQYWAGPVMAYIGEERQYYAHNREITFVNFYSPVISGNWIERHNGLAHYQLCVESNGTPERFFLPWGLFHRFLSFLFLVFSFFYLFFFYILCLFLKYTNTKWSYIEICIKEVNMF